MTQTQTQHIFGTVLRVVLGLVFLVHGLAKMQMGLDNVSGWFSSMGIPAFMAYFIAYLEMIGGVAMILGIGTRYVALLFVGIMVVAILKVKLAAGFTGSAQSPGYEFDLVLLAISAYFVAVPGAGYSLDKLLFSRTQEQV